MIRIQILFFGIDEIFVVVDLCLFVMLCLEYCMHDVEWYLVHYCISNKIKEINLFITSHHLHHHFHHPHVHHHFCDTGISIHMHMPPSIPLPIVVSLCIIGPSTELWFGQATWFRTTNVWNHCFSSKTNTVGNYRGKNSIFDNKMMQSSRSSDDTVGGCSDASSAFYAVYQLRV